MDNIIVVGNTPDNPFADDIGHFMGQREDISDIISLKVFLNTEFCPRFIVDEEDWDNIGNKLKDKKVVIVSTSMGRYTRNDLAMRNFLVARAAKDNGADEVTLLEPDLYYSAQDRGPRPEHGLTAFDRSKKDFKKFDGQPFSSRMYAELLKVSGVDQVMTVHNHSESVNNVYMDRFSGRYHNLFPTEVFHSYIVESDVANQRNMVICAPDEGARHFARELQEAVGSSDVPLLSMAKVREGERDVTVCISGDSQIGLEDVKGKDVIIIDDMVRTGSTIVENCRMIKEADPNRILFFVTHFFPSQEVKANLNDPLIDEIVSTNTVPQVLNRDMQGRLRKKMVVLKIERWLARYILEEFAEKKHDFKEPLYSEDMSSKNPRWKGRMGPLFS
jgi:ribose-phosphate pyrophosphokinase